MPKVYWYSHEVQLSFVRDDQPMDAAVDDDWVAAVAVDDDWVELRIDYLDEQVMVFCSERDFHPEALIPNFVVGI